jgi:hypothetical protein
MCATRTNTPHLYPLIVSDTDWVGVKLQSELIQLTGPALHKAFYIQYLKLFKRFMQWISPV